MRDNERFMVQWKTAENRAFYAEKRKSILNFT